jgi:aerobic C4-dicarboxylate transport protein
MNEARAVTNLIGNGVATIAIAKWDNAFDQSKAREVMRLHQEGRTWPADDPHQDDRVPSATH